MNLTEQSLPARESKFGQDEFQAIGGQSLLIETSPMGAEILDVAVPAGKVWDVEVTVRIVESPE